MYRIYGILRNFLWGTLGRMVVAYEKSLQFPEGSAFTMVETRGIEPLTS